MASQLLEQSSPSFFTFQFVVRADDWDEAAAMLKDELGITKKHDVSDRQVNGLYLVSCTVDATHITKEFYKKITNSKKIAIHSDDKSSSLYPKILEEVEVVEERLRWLLLHVSDAIEGYVKLLGCESSDLIRRNSLDPLTSRLSFEAMLALLEVDQSWARDGIDDAKMRALLEGNDDFASFKANYLERTTLKTVWESISELVLQRPVKWETIAPRLKSVKALRNKCAHFHTVTDDDLSQAKHLKAQIMRNLAKKKNLTLTDMKAFASLSKAMEGVIKAMADSAIVPQSAFQGIASMRLAFDPMIDSQQTALKAAQSTIRAVGVHPSSSFIDSIVRARDSIGHFNAPSQHVADEAAAGKKDLLDEEDLRGSDSKSVDASKDGDEKGGGRLSNSPNDSARREER